MVHAVELVMRARPTYLSEDQMETIGKHVVKERGVELNPDGSFVLKEGEVDFRVNPSRLARESSAILGKNVTPHGLHKAVNWFARNGKRFGIVINVPAQSSVQEEMLKATISKLEVEIATLNKKVEEQKLLLQRSYERFKQAKELFS